jgi:mono/diheme cytochrome c family protein
MNGSHAITRATRVKRLSGAVCAYLIPISCLFPCFAAEPPDISKLPASAPASADFTRDIQPVFEQSCLRCHGPEKPRGGFRLDHREAALKGGDTGIAIIPGDSAQSPLIHYVARLVPDMEMPPEGKGDPLTAEQIALLRAWIDQGADWPATPATGKLRYSVSPMVQWTMVSGNEGKFREHYRQREGWSGGVQHFELEQSLDADTRVKVEGRALAGQQDYRVALELRRIETGFIRAGYQESRSYFDDTGGFYEPFNLAPARLGRDLHVDRGKASLDLGLLRPDWPRMTLGYAYQFQEGVKSTLQWGGVTAGGTTKSIQPAFKAIDEQVHVLRFDLEHELAGTRIEDEFRAEFGDLRTHRANADFLTFDFGSRYDERYRWFQGANSLRLERLLRDGWFVSGGYLFTRHSGEGAFRQATFMPSTGAVIPLGAQDNTPLLTLKSSSHVFNANNRFGPWEGLTFTAALQNEWTRTEGVGNGTVLAFPPPLFAPTAVAHRQGSGTDKGVFEERFELRYDRIPRTVVTLETRFRQETIGQFERGFIDDAAGTDKDFVRDTDATGDLREFKGGFSVSPWTPVTFSASYRRRLDRDDYDHRTDTDGSAFLPPGTGYPAFLLAREEATDEFEARLAWRLTRWLRATFKYELTATDFANRTAPATTFPAGGAPGGDLLAGNYDAHTWSANFTLTPWTRLYLNAGLTYTDTRQVSGVNNGTSIVPFGGGTWSAIHSGTFVLGDKDDLHFSHAFSRADFGQASQAAGLPLGLNYALHSVEAGWTRRFRENLRTGVQYLFQSYRERGNGGFNDYTAHGVFGTMTLVLP